MSTAGVVDITGVIPRTAALAGGLTAGVGHQEGRVGAPPYTVGPVQGGLTATTLELQQRLLVSVT